uniref:Uncharacterized protein n=1 Tax=Glossina palpalis gambiensis TaxID=67801 RepID=A0A1B0B2I9_9MUSC
MEEDGSSFKKTAPRQKDGKKECATELRSLMAKINSLVLHLPLSMVYLYYFHLHYATIFVLHNKSFLTQQHLLPGNWDSTFKTQIRIRLAGMSYFKSIRERVLLKIV